MSLNDDEIIPLYVRKVGTGHIGCVLIHGAGDNGIVWETLCESISHVVTTYSVDLRGHGHSAWSSHGSYKIKHYIEDVLKFIAHISQRPIVLIGHSLGASVALHIAALNNNNIAALVLVDFGPDAEEWGARRVSDVLRESTRYYLTFDEYLQWLKRTRPLASVSLLERIAKESSITVDGYGVTTRFDPAVIDDRDEESDKECSNRLWSLLRKITVPTLVVRGSGSAILSRQVAQKMVSLCANSSLRTINAAGHCVATDNPIEFNAVVSEFLHGVLPAHKK